MPRLKFDPLDLLDCLEVAPADDEDTELLYDVKQGDLRLRFCVWPFESVVELTLLRDTTRATIFSCVCFVRDNVRFVNDKRGKYLALNDCVIAGARFWYFEAGDVFDHQRFPCGVTVEISVRPEISVMIVPYRSL